MDEAGLRSVVPGVIGVLVRRGADFAAAEDAVQEALIETLSAWPKEPPRDERGWLITVAWRKFLDAVRSEQSRRNRELIFTSETSETSETSGTSGTAEEPDAEAGGDDTLRLYFLCAHPILTPSSAVALTLRAVGGLTTKQIAGGYLVPESTMAQRISRAKSRLAGAKFTDPGEIGAVLKVLYLVFNEGYSGAVDLAAEAIRLTGQLRAMTEDPEVAGLLSLMLLHQARRASRMDEHVRLVGLADQDRSRWDSALIMDGVEILQGALAHDQLGEYQAQAAIAALHADAASVEETDWVQIVEWSTS